LISKFLKNLKEVIQSSPLKRINKIKLYDLLMIGQYVRSGL